MVRDALAHPDDSRAAALLETLRKNPAEYSRLSIDAEKTAIAGRGRGKRLEEAEARHRSAMGKLRSEVISARRAVVAERARRFAATPEAATPAPAIAPQAQAPEPATLEPAPVLTAATSEKITPAPSTDTKTAVQGPASEALAPEAEAEHARIETIAVPRSEEAANAHLLEIAKRFKMGLDDTKQVASVLSNLHSASAKSLKKGVRRTTSAKQAA